MTCVIDNPPRPKSKETYPFPEEIDRAIRVVTDAFVRLYGKAGKEAARALRKIPVYWVRGYARGGSAGAVAVDYPGKQRFKTVPPMPLFVEISDKNKSVGQRVEVLIHEFCHVLAMAAAPEEGSGHGPTWGSLMKASGYAPRTTLKENPSPSSAAVSMYRSFQGFEPRKIGEFSSGFSIPTIAALAGPALNVMYRSDKNNPTTGKPERGPIDYIHDHEKGVNVYRCDRAAGRGDTAVPGFICDCTELVKLGDCLGFTYDSGDGAIEASPTHPMPELYTIPSGRALLVIQSKRKVLALIWGGKLGVEARGIVY